MSRQSKLHFKWQGPYRIQDGIPRKGTYLLEELDGTTLRGTFAGNRLKEFHVRDASLLPANDAVMLEFNEENGEEEEEAEEEDTEEVVDVPTIRVGKRVRRRSRKLRVQEEGEEE